MDFFTPYYGYDVTQLVEQYQGSKLEELFQNQQVVKNKMGQFLEFIWEEEKIPFELNLTSTKDSILRNLKTVFYVGEFTEKKLIRRGISSLYDLRLNLKYQKSANRLIQSIKNKDYIALCENKYINDIDTAFCFKVEDFLFLDIETLGLYETPIIIVGIGFYVKNKFNIRLLFSRELEEEIAILEHLRKEILPNFKCFITYNGKTFDIPYIANRFLYFFDENPMISENEIPYENVNTKYHHIDLYHNCRRKFKEMFFNYTLTNMEKELLNLERKNHLPSNMVGTCYRKYLKDPERYIGLIKECIDHNYYDIYSLPLILRKILQD